MSVAGPGGYALPGLGGLELDAAPAMAGPSDPQPLNRDAQATLCVCGRWFRYRSSMYRHLKYECGKEPRFQCHLCAFRTKRELSLRRHLGIVHGAAPASAPAAAPALQ